MVAAEFKRFINITVYRSAPKYFDFNKYL
jgi:hypothetical protein